MGSKAHIKLRTPAVTFLSLLGATSYRSVLIEYSQLINTISGKWSEHCCSFHPHHIFMIKDHTRLLVSADPIEGAGR